MENQNLPINDCEVASRSNHILFHSAISQQKPQLFQNIHFSDPLRTFYKAKMINWMIQVFAYFRQRCTWQTYFKSITLWDWIFHKLKICSKSEILVYGLGCIRLASQLNSKSIITLQQTANKIGYGSYNNQEIKKVEDQIKKQLGLKIYNETLYDIIKKLVQKLKYEKIIKEKDNQKLLKECCKYICIFYFDPKIIHDFSFHELSITILKYTLIKNSNLLKNNSTLNKVLFYINNNFYSFQLEHCLCNFTQIIFQNIRKFSLFVNINKFDLDI